MSSQKLVQYTFLILLSFCSILFATSVRTAENPNLAKGKTIPDIEAYSIEGLPVSLHPGEGKYCLLLFFSDTDQEMQECMSEAYVLYKRFRDHGLIAVAVWKGQTEDSIFSHSERWQIPWPQIIDEDSDPKPFEIIGIETTPVNLLIDSSGKIIAVEMKGENAHKIIAEKLNVSLDSLPMPESPTDNPPTSIRNQTIYFTNVLTPGQTFEQRMGTPSELKEAEKCKENLRKISIAITDYKNDHDGELPNWLSDLYPKYLQDESILLCPNNPNPPTSFTNTVDPNMTCSYMFEFAPTEGLGRNYREWKTGQLSQFGDRVPVVICMNHPPKRLNLWYSGEVFFSSHGWENDVPQGKTLNDPEAQVRKTFRQMASAFAKYKADHDGKLPMELDDLYPKYVKDKSLLRCPVTGSEYSYQFSATGNQRNIKIQQLEVFGGYVPVLRSRAVMDNGNVINLAYNGEIYSSETIWERHFGGNEAYGLSRVSQTSTDEQPSKGLDAKLTAIAGMIAPLSKYAPLFKQICGVTLVVDEDADKEVSLTTHNKTLREVLDDTLPPLNLDYIEQPGYTVRIGTKEKIQEIKMKAFPTKIARAEADLRSIGTALEMFFIDNNSYPVPHDGNTLDKAYLSVGDRKISITEPVRYIRSLPIDPFGNESSYRYISDGNNFWILASNGPNGMPELDLKIYDPQKGFSSDKLDEYKFHPSNGIDSKGDIIRVGP